jgi:hypothetical protein
MRFAPFSADVVANPGFDFVDGFVGRGSPSRNADGFDIAKPFEAQFPRALNMMDATCMAAASLDEFACVIAVNPANHDDYIGLLREFHCRMLSLLRRLANRVNELHFRAGESLLNETHQVPDSLNRLGGLRGDTIFGALRQILDILLGKDDVEGFEVTGHAADFHMIALSDDDRMVTFSHESAHSPVRQMDERAGGFQDFEAMLADAFNGAIRSAMGGNHNPGSGDIGDLVLGLDPLSAKLLKHHFVMHQVAEDGERLRFGFVKGERNGVADSEAHTHVVGANNLHAKINFG